MNPAPKSPSRLDRAKAALEEARATYYTARTAKERAYNEFHAARAEAANLAANLAAYTLTPRKGNA